VVGLTNVRHILCDEAGLYSRYFWDNIQGRSSIGECPITIVTSPYSLNWLYNDYIRKHNGGDPFIQSLVHLCQAKSAENPYFSSKEYDLKSKTMDARRFSMMYGGNFDKAQGLVYDILDSKQHAIAPIKLPAGTRFFGGLDWGYTDPTAIVVRGVTEDGSHYTVDELRLDEIVEQCARLKALYNIERFFADPSRPDHIASLNTHGIPTVGATNDILPGIEAHYELIKTGRFYLFKGCTHSIDEYEMYHYPEPSDLKPDQNQSKLVNVPVDQFNHCMDAERYVTMGTIGIGLKNMLARQSDIALKNKTIPYNKSQVVTDKLFKKRKHG
jgi:hypothetical protein